MDNKEFLDEILNHNYIALYHSLIVSAQQGYLVRGGSWSEKQIATFAIKQAQETIKVLGYTNGSDVKPV